MLASLASTYGCILKIDSSKKICKMMQGHAARTANRPTSVGNKSAPALKRLVNRLMERYKKGGQQSPMLLYTDRDCCGLGGPSKYQFLFSDWKWLQVRLDIWHFMRRIAGAATSESHPPLRSLNVIPPLWSLNVTAL